MNSILQNLENKVVSFCQKYYSAFARFALFVIYFWFGFLKIIDISPANPLVSDLQHKTLPFLTFSQFIVIFALFEMFIGILFLFPKLTRFVVVLFVLHMITTFMPLVFLPEVGWQKAFVPTLEGQYIIKNLALIAAVMAVVSKGNRPNLT